MAWEAGNQARTESRFKGINQRVMEVEGHMDEKDAKLLLYEFMRHNLTYAANLLLGIELFPLQHIMIKAMLESDYTLGIVSRGGSKSWASGVYCALDAIFNQGIRIGILAASFRQSKQIFLYIEEFYNKKEAVFFRQCVGKKTNIKKANDQWSMKVGASEIVALPLGNGEKLRGFRFHRIVIDEALLMPEKILNEVILPFLGVVDNPVERQKIHDLEDKLILEGKMEEGERVAWPNNKLIALSSASYKFEHLYGLYEKYEKMIMNPKKGDTAARAILHFAWDVIPSEYFDKNLLKHSQETMSQSQFDREFGAIFTDDSSGFFKMSKMKACYFPDGGDGQSIETMGDPNGDYILSFDPSWSESESSDDFAIHVIKLDLENQTGTVVHSYAMAGTRLKDHIFYFHYLLSSFNVKFIIGDYMSGVQFISAAQESSLFENSEIEIKVDSDLNFDDPTKYLEMIGQLKKDYASKQDNSRKKYYCHLRKPSSNWIRIANETLQGNFEHKRIRFASRAYEENFDLQRKHNIPITKMRFIPEHAQTLSQEDAVKGVADKSGALMVDFVEHQSDMIELTIEECALIDVKINPQGSQTFDLPQELRTRKGPNRPRKDSYSALVLGSWGMRIYFDMLKEPEKLIETTFMPFMV